MQAIELGGGIVMVVAVIVYILYRAATGNLPARQPRARRPRRHGHRLYVVARLGWLRWLWW